MSHLKGHTRGVCGAGGEGWWEQKVQHDNHPDEKTPLLRHQTKAAAPQHKQDVSLLPCLDVHLKLIRFLSCSPQTQARAQSKPSDASSPPTAFLLRHHDIDLDQPQGALHHGNTTSTTSPSTMVSTFAKYARIPLPSSMPVSLPARPSPVLYSSLPPPSPLSA